MEQEEIKTPEEKSQAVAEVLREHGLDTVTKVRVRDPITKQTREITIDRNPNAEQALLVALSDPKTSREQKDYCLSMLLWERGGQSASMIVDLMRYKGEHTKESRVFSAQMRFDYESFVSSFTNYLGAQAKLIGITLGVDIRNEKGEFMAWLSLPNNTGKNYTYKDFYSVQRADKPTSDERIALIELAIYALDEATTLLANVDKIIHARESGRGKGIYVDLHGRPYTLSDAELEDIIKRDRELKAEAEKDDEYDG